MTLSQLKAALREGQDPILLGGTRLELGPHLHSYKAYGIGPFIVKKGVLVASKTEYEAHKKERQFRFAPTLRVNDWTIQLAYKRLSDVYDGREGRQDVRAVWPTVYPDIHPWNVGIDRRGRYVAFDW